MLRLPRPLDVSGNSTLSRRTIDCAARSRLHALPSRRGLLRLLFTRLRCDLSLLMSNILQPAIPPRLIGVSGVCGLQLLVYRVPSDRSPRVFERLDPVPQELIISFSVRISTALRCERDGTHWPLRPRGLA